MTRGSPLGENEVNAKVRGEDRVNAEWTAFSTAVRNLAPLESLKKAKFIREDLFSRKQSVDSDIVKKDGVSEPILPQVKRSKLSSGASAVLGEENEAEDISVANVTKIFRTSEGSELMVLPVGQQVES